MDCPRDSVEMTELSEGEERLLFRCAECGGLWLDVADLNRILLHAGLQTLETMGGRANPEEDACDCPVDNVALLAIQSHHKRDPLIYETCESCGGIWIESNDFSNEGDDAKSLTEGIVGFYRDFAEHVPPAQKPHAATTRK